MGSNNSLPFPDRAVSSDVQTCGDAVTLSKSVSGPHELCATIKMKGFIRSGCKKLSKLYIQISTLCFDPANPDNFIDTIFASQMNYGCTDAALDIFASWDVLKECLRSQAQAILDCGCYLHQTGCEYSQSSRSMPVVLRRLSFRWKEGFSIRANF